MNGIDVWIQKRFDRVAHHCMREYGWTKRGLRKGGYIARMVSWLVYFGALGTKPGPDEMFWIYGFIALAVIHSSFSIMRTDERDDRASERTPSVVSAADKPDRVLPMKVIGIAFEMLGLLFLVMERYSPRGPHWAVVGAAGLCLGCTLLYHGYLIRTPPAQPKPKTQEVPDALPDRA